MEERNTTEQRRRNGLPSSRLKRINRARKRRMQLKVGESRHITALPALQAIAAVTIIRQRWRAAGVRP